MAVSFIDGGNRITQRNPLTCRKLHFKLDLMMLHRVHPAMSGIQTHNVVFHFIMMWQSVLLVEETWVLGVKPPTWCKSLTNFCHIITKCCIKYTSPWVGIKITKLVHVCILSVSNLYRIRAYKTSLTLPLFIEMSVPSQESERSCICVLGATILSFSTILVFDFGIVPTVWYFLFFVLFVHRMPFA